MEFFAALFGKVLDCTLLPIGRQLSYLFFYERNSKKLEKQLDNLQLVRERVQSLVNQEKSNSLEIYNDVLTWLAEVDTKMSQGNEIGLNRNGSYLSCLYKLVHCHPRKTKNMLKYILKLIDDGKKFNKDNVGRPAPLPNTKCPSLPVDYQILKSRTLIAEKVKDALANPTINKVGISGMGGAGKTKMLSEVKKLVLESNLFDRVIIVTIGTSKGVVEIQDEIGGMLNMEMVTTSKEVRASLLQTKIVEMKENVLIMLDDLWNEYDLENDLGIPCRLESRMEGCKILMTSRFRDLLTNQLNVEKSFEVNPLNEQESWKFFIAIVGEFVEDDIERVAKNVVKECGGLPIALMILAKSLKGKQIQVWKDALKKLNNHVFVDIPGVKENVYTCLKHSYDSIEDEAKLLLLMCSVFPDDHAIPVNDLQMYAMGIGMLNDINSWEDARNRVMKLVDTLKSFYLLIDTDIFNKFHVQMHDVVRDVVKYIASKIYKMPSLTYGCGQSDHWQEKDKHGSYNAIFVDCKDFTDLPSKLEFSNLQLLVLRRPWHPQDLQISDGFFKGMETLRVLDMTKMCFDPLRTSLTHSLKNLQTLHMSHCKCNDIDTIGQLKKLKILKIDHGTIQELSASMSQLTELKVLEVMHCSKLEVIHPNIISSMTKLEELSLLSSFQRWGEEVVSKGRIIKNVKLSELDCATHLSVLRIEIKKVDMLINELSLERARKLEEFWICAGFNVWQHYRRYTRILMLRIESNINWHGGALEILLQGCEVLRVVDSVGFTKALFKPNGNYVYPRLRRLGMNILEGSDMTHENTDITPFFQVPLPELSDLLIDGGIDIEKFWHINWPTVNSFSKLLSVFIIDCPQLTHVFPSNMVRSLPILKSLRITKCESMETVFEIEEPAENGKIILPLFSLMLSNLPNLKYVWNNDPGEHLIFPHLKHVNVYRCPRLKSIFPDSFIKYMEKIEILDANGDIDVFPEDEISKLIMNIPEVVLFPRLIELTIHCKQVGKRSYWHRSESFTKLQSLFLIGSKDDGMVTLPLEMRELPYKIEEFKISYAFQLAQVFNNHNQHSAKLKRLFLTDLPNLTHVWEEYNTPMISNFDSLESIEVYSCMNLKYLLPSLITFSNLKELRVCYCNGMMNLFSSSVAKNLKNLKTMKINGCGEMSSIIVAEGEEEISFDRMSYLSFCGLQKLTSFYSGKSTLKFPSLENLRIIKCPEMKTFSYGMISMPKFPIVALSYGKDNVRVSPTKDVNDIIQHFWMDEVVKSIQNLFTPDE